MWHWAQTLLPSYVYYITQYDRVFVAITTICTLTLHSILKNTNSHTHYASLKLSLHSSLLAVFPAALRPSSLISSPSRCYLSLTLCPRARMMKFQPVTYITVHLTNSQDNDAAILFCQLSSPYTHPYDPIGLPVCINVHNVYKKHSVKCYSQNILYSKCIH